MCIITGDSNYYPNCYCKECQEKRTYSPDHKTFFDRLTHIPESEVGQLPTENESHELVPKEKQQKMVATRCWCCEFAQKIIKREYVVLYCPIEKEEIRLIECPKIGATWYKF